MAKVRLPHYVRPKKLAGNKIGYFWERPTWAKPPAERNGRTCPVDSEPLGTDLAAAWAKAEILNAALDEWRIGLSVKPVEGTVAALFGWYRGLERFKALKFKGRRDYRAMMDKLESFPLKSTTLGQRQAAELTAAHADALHRAIEKKHGQRTAVYAMQVARRVWNEAIRHKKLKGPNIFSRMGLSSKAKKGNRATSRKEYDLFRATAREMGIQSMATAAALSFELVRRQRDVFGFLFDENEEAAPRIAWEDYQPGEQIALQQGKTGDRQIIPLRGDQDPAASGQPGPLLYPDLEEELARMERGAGHIVINEATGQRYTEDEAGRVFRKIRDKAKLPKGMTLTGFRHGGATELGDAGVYDVRPVSGHRTLQQTSTYNKVTEGKARSAGTKRRHFIETSASNG